MPTSTLSGEAERPQVADAVIEAVPGKPWSIFQLQHTLRLRVMMNQVEHRVKVKMGKTYKAA
jgi:hypothetical protein